MSSPSPGDQIEFTLYDGKIVVGKVVNVDPVITLEVPPNSGNQIQMDTIGPFKSLRVIPKHLSWLL